MEPESDEADDVNHGSVPLREGSLKEECAVSGVGDEAVYSGIGREVVRQEFLKLHLCPELNHVHYKECKDDNAEHEHVFRRPFNTGIVGVDGITVDTAGAAVLHRKPEGVNDMDDEQESEPH